MIVTDSTAINVTCHIQDGIFDALGDNNSIELSLYDHNLNNYGLLFLEAVDERSFILNQTAPLSLSFPDVGNGVIKKRNSSFGVGSKVPKKQIITTPPVS